MIEITEQEIMKNWKDKTGDFINKPVVSIRCITFNHEKYIEQCLDSFLMQKTLFSFEIVVHDDASTDNTADIIKEYQLKYPNIIKPIFEKENQYSKHDGSLAKAIDTNLNGRFIASCEGDDFWCDELKLQKQYDFLIENKEYIAVGHHTRVIDKDNNPIDFRMGIKTGEYTITDNEKWRLFSHASSWFYRREFIDFLFDNFDEYKVLQLPGDRIYPVMWLAIGKLYVMPLCGSVYRYQSGLSSYSANVNNLEDYKIYTALDSLSQFAGRHGIIINYNKYKNDLLYKHFKLALKGENKRVFFLLLKCRKKMIRDICYCFVRFIVNVPCMIKKRIKSYG